MNIFELVVKQWRFNASQHKPAFYIESEKEIEMMDIPENMLNAVEDKAVQKHPFDKLTVGKCFTVPKAEANVKSLRSMCRYWNNKTGGLFSLKFEKETELYYVVRTL